MEDIDPFRSEDVLEAETERAVNTQLPASPAPESPDPGVAAFSHGVEAQESLMSPEQARRMAPKQPFRLRDADRNPKVFVSIPPLAIEFES